jgi:hypothetical protein
MPWAAAGTGEDRRLPNSCLFGAKINIGKVERINKYVKFNAKNKSNLTFLLTLISGFRRDVDEICVLLGYYATSCGNCSPTVRDNVSVPSSRVKSPRRKERKPATCNVGAIWEGAHGVVISRRDDSQ